MAAMKGSSKNTKDLTFGVPDTAPLTDLSAREISITLFMIYMVSFFEGADMQLLPTSFRALEADLGLSPTTLAASALMQSLTCASFSVFWGVLLDNGILSARSVLFGGCTRWGVVTLLLATINDTSWIMVLRCFNGIALATLSPTTQTLIAELTPQQERGRAYSWSGFSMAMGCMTTAMVTTCISQIRLFGFQGWRVAFAGVGVLSIVLGYFVQRFVKRPNSLDHSSSSSSGMSFASELRTVLSFFEVWTFSVIVVQGTFACIPWTAMSFGTMFLQYCGVPDLTAGCISGLMLFTASFGALLGGYIGDALTKLSRFHGRPFTAQISVAISVPTSLLYYHYVPHSPEGIPYWFVLVMVFGLCSPWCDHGVNRPMLSEVVAPQHRARILGVLCATAGTFGSLGGPLVALVSEAFFGYKTQHVPINQMPEDIRKMNANALGNGLTLVMCVPWTICGIFYTALHWTYEADYVALQKKQEQQLPPDDDEEFLLRPPFWTGGSPC